MLCGSNGLICTVLSSTSLPRLNWAWKANVWATLIQSQSQPQFYTLRMNDMRVHMSQYSWRESIVIIRVHAVCIQCSSLELSLSLDILIHSLPTTEPWNIQSHCAHTIESYLRNFPWWHCIIEYWRECTK